VQVIGSLATYWARAMPAELGARYPGNPSGYFYYRPEEKPGPPCGRQQAPPRNAFYCPTMDPVMTADDQVGKDGNGVSDGVGPGGLKFAAADRRPGWAAARKSVPPDASTRAWPSPSRSSSEQEADERANAGGCARR
jgi:hypothetical protein